MSPIQAQREINSISLGRRMIASDTCGKSQLGENNRGGGGWQSRQSDRHAGQSHRCTDGQNDRQRDRQSDILLCKPPQPYHDMNIEAQARKQSKNEKQTEFWHFKKTTCTYITFTGTKPVRFRCWDSDIWFRDRGAMWSQSSEGEEGEQKVQWRDTSRMFCLFKYSIKDR